MCKIAAIFKHDPKTLKHLISTVWREMATTEKDGFGAAYRTKSGKLAVIRSHAPTPRALPAYAEGFYMGINTDEESDGGPVIFHGRTATCGITLENTHPMAHGQTALVHNGIVSCPEKAHRNESTSNDSELVLRAYLAGGIDEVARSLSGYYAYAALTITKGGYRMDIARDARARLRVGEDAAGNYGFATTDSVLRAAGLTPLADFQTCIQARFTNGRHTKITEFIPRKDIPSHAKRGAQASLGYAFDDFPTYRGGKGAWYGGGSTNWRQEEREAAGLTSPRPAVFTAEEAAEIAAKAQNAGGKP